MIPALFIDSIVDQQLFAMEEEHNLQLSYHSMFNK